MKDILNDKIERSKEVLKEAFDKWGRNICVLCDFGKGCVVLLHLIKEVYGEVIFPILFIDHKQHFPEIYEFKESLSSLWNLKILSVTPKREYDQIKEDKTNCCHWLKIEPLLRSMKENNWDACCIAAYSNREDTHQNIVKREGEEFFRVYPLSDWSETDIWRYIRLFDLPYCPIYDKGYKTINCKACSKPVFSIASKPEEEAVDKDEIVKRLHKLGYF